MISLWNFVITTTAAALFGDRVQLTGGGGNSTRSMQQDPWIPIGGGAVNEKKRRQQPHSSTSSNPYSSKYDPSRVKSHLWHALEGLDRYPNYLSRWTEDDMDRLEEALEKQMAHVKEQRRLIGTRRSRIKELLHQVSGEPDWSSVLIPPKDWEDVKRILHPRLVKAIFHSHLFRNREHLPSIESVMNGDISVELSVSSLTELMDEELLDVYSFDLFSSDFCEQLRSFVMTLARAGMQDHYKDLLLGRRPFDMDAIGLSWLTDLLFHLVIRPMARHLFQSADIEGELDWRHGFISGYSAQPGEGKPRERLVTHTDDSEVTLNVCLGDVFKGGLLEFRGLRGTNEEGQVMGVFRPRPGLALLHAGRHFHDVTQVTEGDRFALIVWARSWQGIRAETCPCCWLNRRVDKSCICGPRWN